MGNFIYNEIPKLGFSLNRIRELAKDLAGAINDLEHDEPPMKMILEGTASR